MDTADSHDDPPIPRRSVEEAARPEAEARLDERLPAKLSRIADRRLVGLAKEAYRYATHPAVWRRTKLLGVGALLYLLAPLDAVAPGNATGDPFLWACVVAGVLGLGHQLLLAGRVWRRWAAASPQIKEPLAFAIVSLADWRQMLALALPLIALAALLVLRSVWAELG